MMDQFTAEGSAIDLEHLRRMTMGDAALEREVLSLFYAHSALLMQRMRSSDPAGLPALAHTLKGSALGIGANAVARAADGLRRLPGEQTALLRVETAVDEARAAIAGMLARSGD
jgi:HPt (histidine-containing phosphotransfer) domain-containing protein